MRKIQLLFLRFYEEFHRLFPRLWRVYKQSRLLRIASVVAAVPLVLILCGIIYISYNRVDLPDLDAFIRFEPPTMGHIYDANGNVLIALGRERREIIQYKDVPDILRQAILSAEDENFFSPAGVDFSVFPRMLGKTNVHALFAHFGALLSSNQPSLRLGQQPTVLFLALDARVYGGPAGEDRGGEAPAGGEFAADDAPLRANGGDDIVENLVHGVFVEDAQAAVGEEVHLQGF